MKVTLPKTQKREHTFSGCESLRLVCVEDGCAADLSMLETYARAEVGPSMGAMTGLECVWDLRELKDVVIPDGVERIGSRWFWGSGIESVAIPASVREIGTEAFGRCESLRFVIFTESISPETTTSAIRIEKNAFQDCDCLETI